VSDIPVGSPPVPPGRHAAPSGWYPDPTDLSQERYWDGWQWSRNTRAGENPPAHGYPGAQNWRAASAPGAQAQQPYQPQPQPHQQPYQPYQQPYPGQHSPQPWGLAGAGRPANTALTADGVPLAGWWWRVLAVILDAMLVWLVAAVPSIPIYAKVVNAMSAVLAETLRAARAGEPTPAVPPINQFLSATDQLMLVLIALTVGMVYHSLFLRFSGATPGKMICGLRVVPVEQGQYRGRLSWATALVRAAIWVAPGAISYLVLFRVLDVLFPLWHPRRQAVHDIVAKTQVVKIR
jgi:uncharacterized RDD family membrane protein YckC